MNNLQRLCSGIMVSLALAGCTTPRSTVAGPGEPANLTPHKTELRLYQSSGRYARDIATVAAEAQGWVEARAAKRAPGERLAIVFDLDETLLSNWVQMSEYDFGYVESAWNTWVDSAQGAPIEPVRDVYRAARARGVDVIFITGRGEHNRDGTLRNLTAIGCGEFAGIYFKPATAGTTGAFKTATRRQLVADGYVIIANIGDQLSDLSGGFAERTFKLPDPFYLTE